MTSLKFDKKCASLCLPIFLEKFRPGCFHLGEFPPECFLFTMLWKYELENDGGLAAALICLTVPLPSLASLNFTWTCC